MGEAAVKRVFLVDDDADIRRLAGVAFKALSQHEFNAFEDGVELRAALAEGLPDLLVLDVMMPGQSGTELLQSLRDELGDQVPPTVFLTAKVQDSEVAELRSLGVEDVLAKPFAPKQLVDQIDALMSG